MPRGKRTKKKYQQLYDGVWYRIDDNYTHVCCDCGLAHDVKYKLENGVLFVCWDIDEKETAAARRIMKKEREKENQ